MSVQWSGLWMMNIWRSRTAQYPRALFVSERKWVTATVTFVSETDASSRFLRPWKTSKVMKNLAVLNDHSVWLKAWKLYQNPLGASIVSKSRQKLVLPNNHTF